MRKNLDRFTIWHINKDGINLDEILKLLKKNYNQTISYLEKFDINDNDKTLNNKWISPSGDNNLRIDEFRFKINEDSQEEDKKEKDNKVEFIHATGLFETNLSEEKAIINGNILPRESRIFNHSCEACFVEINENMYVILKINSTDESKVRNKLMKYKDGKNKNLWGKIKYHKVNGYELNSEFFYWLLYKKDTPEEIILESEKVRVLDVTQVSQKDKSEVYTTHNIGKDILGSTSALSAFGESQVITETGAAFINESFQIEGLVNNNSVFYVDLDKTDINSEGNNFITNAMNIYYYLIPQLNKAWIKEKDEKKWNDSLLNEAIKKWAMNAIINLAEANGITSEEISNTLDEE